tara:strand:+ start:903 stop:1481 length:579 start_codon:yes stop_codon:yes gene_type:complete
MNGIADLMGDEKADFVYSDPPWGQGNLKYWQTMNKKMTGAKPSEIPYEDFLAVFFTILSVYCKGVAVIEYGKRWREDIIQASKDFGFTHCGIATAYYGSAKQNYPLDIHVINSAGKIKIPEEYIAKAASLKDLKCVEAAFDHFAPKKGIVLDPMCGMGFTAQAAVDRGLQFFGNELNEKRLEKTIARLEKSL